MKKTKPMIILLLFAILTITVVVHVRESGKIRFYYPFPQNNVKRERLLLARELLAGHADTVSGMLVAESKSRKIHWAFISDEDWAEDERQQILDELFEYMLKSGPLFPVIWEVYFCWGETVKYGYVSTLGDDARLNGEDSFTEWYSMPDVESFLSYDMLRKLMKHPAHTLYWFGPDDSKTPNLPEWLY